MRWTPFLGLLAAGCSDGLEISPYADTTLAPGSVQTDEEYQGDRRDWAGTLSLDGEPGDYAISAITGAGRIDIDVRTPTGADLSLFDGVEATRISIFEDGLTGELSLFLSDAAGPLYLFETVKPSVISAEAFGGNFAKLGHDVGGTSVSNTDLRLRSAIISTDNGLVEAFPGWPIEIEVNNLHYRFVLLASWKRTIPEGIGVTCSPNDLFSYEATRIELGTDVDETPIRRATTVPDIDGGACRDSAITF